MSDKLVIPQDLKKEYVALHARNDGGMDAVGIRLIERIARAEAEVAELRRTVERLEAPFVEVDVDRLYMVLSMMHENPQNPAREDLLVTMNALIAARAGQKEDGRG